MAFTVEDGNGLPTANAFITLVFANAYFSDRGITAWTGADAVKEIAIIKATDYIETVYSTQFRGTKAFVSCPSDESIDQALSFPRTYNGLVPEKPAQIEAALKKACAEYALRALSAALLTDPEVDASGLQVASKTETVGPITEQVAYYNVGGIQVTQPYPAADLLLKSLLKPGGTVIRG